MDTTWTCEVVASQTVNIVTVLRYIPLGIGTEYCWYYIYSNYTVLHQTYQAFHKSSWLEYSEQTAMCLLLLLLLLLLLFFLPGFSNCFFFGKNTPPKFNSSPLKNDAWKVIDSSPEPRPKKPGKTRILSIESWLVNDGIPYFMVYQIIPI